MEGVKHSISQQIKEIRIRKGLTQKELGVKIGVSESAVARYESGTLNMSTEVLFKIANAMGMDLKIILTDK
ncbi:helix-turn-helix transcriptional regulator [Spirosoma sp.]|uniref:helix-turn-helix domain-containing protein n=1 Tax=Spirosoma sp. TaxID=1899569 RepID=UPI002614734C|nr:helix-turn-helix transcriptional regulator [Spirosoma sp.]MCX6218348.1 helix-turn-helix transcriptional regulator [Spirosoma sp.]